MYLWEYSLSMEECGWKHIFDDAMESYPNGQLIKGEVRDGSFREFYVDPVKSQWVIRKLFEDSKNEAAAIFNKITNMTLQDNIGRLIYLDAVLLNIILDWRMSTELHYNPAYFLPSTHTEQYYADLNEYFGRPIIYDDIHHSKIFKMYVDYTDGPRRIAVFDLQ